MTFFVPETPGTQPAGDPLTQAIATWQRMFLAPLQGGAFPMSPFQPTTTQATFAFDGNPQAALKAFTDAQEQAFTWWLSFFGASVERAADAMSEAEGRTVDVPTAPAAVIAAPAAPILVTTPIAAAKPAPKLVEAPAPIVAKSAAPATVAEAPVSMIPKLAPIVSKAAVAKPAPVAAKPAPVAAAPAPVSAKSAVVETKPAPVSAKPVAAKPAPKAAPAPAVDAAGDFDDDAVEKVVPKLLQRPQGKADDLQVIKGIGPKLDALLHDLGVWHYRQIAEWTPGEIAWVNSKIDFKGRIQREKWVAQARVLASGK